ncbi:alr0857 family protein [Thermocoleostomius sinensis]|uniref:Uncharacterized protein n=1 Tax=Thermocoleostomius sinensis A174 TaxID=2016057 RepID=A0A9E8ZD18_9CYAN|nr:alr0857 family protein [Thermocoleostomius sinensis]WAL61030.1 hypothetical protein OXH18_03240 [Thermocoleostomius sinensis A174]
MLKVAYTESGLHIERLNQSVEEWISLRVVLALRTNRRLMVEHGRASILLPMSLPSLPSLETYLKPEEVETIAISICDDEFVEISLQGIWISSCMSEAEGMFVVALSPRTELVLLQLWQASQTCTFPIWR